LTGKIEWFPDVVLAHAEARTVEEPGTIDLSKVRAGAKEHLAASASAHEADRVSALPSTGKVCQLLT